MNTKIDEYIKTVDDFYHGSRKIPKVTKEYLTHHLSILLSAFAIKVVGHDKSIPEHMKDYVFHSIACEIRAENRLKARQRLKAKEIIENLK